MLKPPWFFLNSFSVGSLRPSNFLILNYILISFTGEKVWNSEFVVQRSFYLHLTLTLNDVSCLTNFALRIPLGFCCLLCFSSWDLLKLLSLCMLMSFIICFRINIGLCVFWKVISDWMDPRIMVYVVQIERCFFSVPYYFLSFSIILLCFISGRRLSQYCV